MICTKNQHHQDWSADYLFFSRARWHTDDLFATILSECAQNSNWYQYGILVALNDTAIKKTGKKIAEVATLRDPMSLPYHVNFMKALRFIQASAVINPDMRMDTARAIPVLFEEAGPAKKPKENAPEQVKQQYKQEQKARRLSVQGHQAILKLREQIDRLPNGQNRLLFAAVDGSYCNGNFLRGLPKSIVVIARTRKDISIFAPITGKTQKDGKENMATDCPRQNKFAETILSPGRPPKSLQLARITNSVIKVLRPFSGKKERAVNRADCSLLLLYAIEKIKIQNCYIETPHIFYAFSPICLSK